MAPISPAITPEICRDVAFQVRRAHVPTWLAEDARQEAFVRILGAAARYRPAVASFRQFCRIQEYGAARDFLRREFQHAHHCRRDDETAPAVIDLDTIANTLADQTDGPERLAAAGEMPALLRELPPLWQFVLIQRYWCDRTLREIAADCGRHLSRVAEIHNQALARLRRHATQIHPNQRAL